ncbi:MAG: phosphoribosyltransferase family protein [bacterium]|uniref:Orotate phosphoribosyltransferase n=2 Tax=Bacteria candidate phyla TaxID=1783234 RepID=A0A101I0D8_UNCT6|nr:MAG: Orotate phosphoribosyltransferase [candidate division TA06 bacterium 32_111]KUK86318.1 MAG: Orotate phosphoribosyltransferase [candidate division TA06 bacterium 34_109]MDI6699860.1 phosphoribosyltransferase family protein [bacterium]HAF08431.1 orotate phosphoribosyltransferase [candidate division WOR-3 bacterium]HCP17215.1 orotate phosphoribosyltransferase [candidate division WOR-3 bacterium]
MDLKRLEKEKVILKGHFLLTSGLHSDTYFEKFRILENPKMLSELVSIVVKKLKGKSFDYVLGPVVGGIVVSYEFARQLKCKAAFLEKRDDKLGLFRGTPITPNDRILLVDDVLTTGKSIYQMIDAVKDFNGNIVSIGVLIDRSDNISFEYPLFYGMKVEAKTYVPENCPLCEKKEILVRPGGKR